MSKDIDLFLDGDPDEKPEIEARETAEHEAAEVAVEEAEAEPVEAEAHEEAEPVAEVAKPDEVKEPDDVVGLRSALQAERAKRHDHKGRADRLEGELAALKAAQEAASKAAAAAPPPPAPKPVEATRPPEPVEQIPIPNPIEDPAGYHDYWARREYNNRLNLSETILRDSLNNDDDVDAKIAKFKSMVERNPALQQELNNHRHPWKYAYDYAKRAMAMEEIGPDPTAYRTKLETELRAKWEAESLAAREKETAAAMAAAPVPQAVAPRQPPPRVNLPTSIGTARSSGGRTAPIQVAEDFNDILGLNRR